MTQCLGSEAKLSGSKSWLYYLIFIGCDLRPFNIESSDSLIAIPLKFYQSSFSVLKISFCVFRFPSYVVRCGVIFIYTVWNMLDFKICGWVTNHSLKTNNNLFNSYYGLCIRHVCLSLLFSC